MTTARGNLVILLTLAGVVVLFLLGVALLTREKENYSLIEDGLYLGGQVKEPPPGTEAALNLCEPPDPYRCAAQVWEPIPDAAPAPDLAWLRRMVEFLAGRRREGVTTFVHCRNGVSRSGMVVVAHEMFKNRWTWDEALAFVRARRPQVRPNPAFMARLLEWERSLRSAPEGRHNA